MGVFPSCLLESSLFRQHTARVRRAAPWLLRSAYQEAARGAQSHWDGARYRHVQYGRARGRNHDRGDNSLYLSVDSKEHDGGIPQEGRNRPESGGGNQAYTAVWCSGGITGYGERHGCGQSDGISRRDHNVGFSQKALGQLYKPKHDSVASNAAVSR